MTDNQRGLLSRRAFARHAAMLSATASLAPAGLILPSSIQATAAPQLPDNFPKLSPEGQAEAEARYQLVLSRHGVRLNEEEKRNVRMMCFFVQPSLDRLRAFSLSNADVPALFLKPIVERDKSPESKRNTAPPLATPNKS